MASYDRFEGVCLELTYFMRTFLSQKAHCGIFSDALWDLWDGSIVRLPGYAHSLALPVIGIEYVRSWTHYISHYTGHLG